MVRVDRHRQQPQSLPRSDVRHRKIIGRADATPDDVGPRAGAAAGDSGKGAFPDQRELACPLQLGQQDKGLPAPDEDAVRLTQLRQRAGSVVAVQGLDGAQAQLAERGLDPRL
jgi:hypothetical protein